MIRAVAVRPLPLLLAALALGGCTHHAAPPPAATARTRVETLRAGVAAGRTLVLPARVSAREEVTLDARIAARLTDLPVREAEHFRRGRALAVFAAAETRAALDGAAAALAAATVARDVARLQESRMDSLHARRVAALHELEGAQAERRAAEAQWAQARAQLEQLRSATRLEAPFDGVVVRRHVDPGATVGPGQPILDLRTDDAGEITASVPESELPRLAGGHAEYQLGDGPWRPATVSRVDGMTDFVARSRVARLRPAGREPLEPGAFARVRLPALPGTAAPAAPPALSVPARALVVRGGLSGVFVVEDGAARLRWLRVGRESGGAVEVLAGLGPEDAVILSPAGLVDGTPVTVAP